MIALKATELPALALIAAALVTHVLIDVRFAHLLDGVIAAPHAVTFATCVGAAALSRVGSPRTRAWRYWLLTFTVAVYLAACHATGIICAYLNPHLRLVLPLHSLRCIGATACVSHFAGLKPLKSW